MLLPVLDDLDRAEKHGDLEEGSRLRDHRGEAARVGRASRPDAVRRGRRPVRPADPRGDLPAAEPRRRRSNTVADVVETGYRRSTRAGGEGRRAVRPELAPAAEEVGGQRPASALPNAHVDKSERRRHGKPGLVRQGLLQGSRRLQGRHARPNSRRRTASSRASTTRTRTRATPRRRRSSRRSARRTRCSADPEQRKEYDQIRAMGSGARFTAPGSAGQGGFDDVFGGMFGGRAAAQRGYTTQQGGQFDDLLRRHVRRRPASVRPPAATAATAARRAAAT